MIADQGNGTVARPVLAPLRHRNSTLPLRDLTLACLLLSKIVDQMSDPAEIDTLQRLRLAAPPVMDHASPADMLNDGKRNLDMMFVLLIRVMRLPALPPASIVTVLPPPRRAETAWTRANVPPNDPDTTTVTIALDATTDVTVKEKKVIGLVAARVRKKRMVTAPVAVIERKRRGLTVPVADIERERKRNIALVAVIVMKTRVAPAAATVRKNLVIRVVADVMSGPHGTTVTKGVVPPVDVTRDTDIADLPGRIVLLLPRMTPIADQTAPRLPRTQGMGDPRDAK